MAFRNKTHTSRWELADSYSENWKQRAIKLMDLFKTHEFDEGSQYRVVEYGCGAYAPFNTLFNGKNGFEVSKYDIKAWDEQTSVIDFVLVLKGLQANYHNLNSHKDFAYQLPQDELLKRLCDFHSFQK